MYADIRRYGVVCIAEALPRWLSPLAVWLINRESNKAERELRKAAEAVGGFFRAVKRSIEDDQMSRRMVEAQVEQMRKLAQYAQHMSPQALSAYMGAQNAYTPPRSSNHWTPFGTVAGFFRGGI